jgi:Lrp/AsnC family transcriptional regulator, leucine-responsive regulatory protein
MEITMPDNEHSLDDIDFAILDLLQSDSSIANSELAAKVGLSPSACLARTKSLRRRGILRHFTAIVDQEKVGLPVSTFTFVTLSKHSRKAARAFLEKIEKMPQVMECYNVTGQADYLLKIISPDISSYRDFVIDGLIGIQGVKHVETLVVLKTEKHHFSLPLSAETIRRTK